MELALRAAASLPRRTWPNPPVGAVVVRDGRVVGCGAHHGPGERHAEIVALAEAGDAARGATLFVTLEPCNHMGRTPPCAPQVAESGVRRVVVAMRDPNPAVTGGGCRFLRDRGLDVTLGVAAEEALELVWPFAVTDGFTRSYIELKTAVSLDGRFAPPDHLRRRRAPVYLTVPESRLYVHRRRRWCDLVVVGEGTVKADRPRLDGRLVAAETDLPQAEPLAGYLDSDLSWSGGFDRERYLVFAGESARRSPNAAAVRADGGDVVFCREHAGRLDLRSVASEAADRGLVTIMFEGGPQLASSCLASGIVDRWLQFSAPVVLGEGITWPEKFPEPPGAGAEAEAKPMSMTRSQVIGRDALMVLDRVPFAGRLAQVSS